MTHTTRRFSELRAEGVESNLFQYHLRHLIRNNLVEKCGEGYRLAPAGLYYADRFSPVHKGERPQPKLVTIAVLRNEAGQALLQQKPRQPWLGQYHLPAGKIHTGETTGEAVTRELEEKTGLHIEHMLFRSIVQVRVFKHGELVSDYFGFIFGGHYHEPVTDVCWYDATDSDQKIDLAPGVEEILAFERLGDGDFHPVRIDIED
jgi:8-oxo-dGTP diphosphatase